MLKWLPFTHNSPSRIITDDPLATIGIHSKLQEIYSVSRVNPLYIDEEYCENDGKKEKIRDEKVPKTSGYEIEKSCCEDDEVKNADEDLFNIRCRVPLSTIPEGQIDATVPRPIWPKRNLSYDTVANRSNSRFDPSTRIHRKAQKPACRVENSKELESKELNSKIDNDKEKIQEVENKIWKEVEEDQEIKAETTSSGSSGFSELATTLSPASSSTQSLTQIYLSEPTNKTSFIKTNIVLATQNSNGKESLYENSPNFFKKNSVFNDRSAHHEADFTLDQEEAEKLLIRLKIRKQHRCICRFVISILSLIVFILCVVVVSLLITNGKRIFGSL